MDMSPWARGQLGDIMGLMIGSDVALDSTGLGAEFGCNLSTAGLQFKFQLIFTKIFEPNQLFIDNITNVTY